MTGYKMTNLPFLGKVNKGKIEEVFKKKEIKSEIIPFKKEKNSAN